MYIIHVDQIIVCIIKSCLICPTATFNLFNCMSYMCSYMNVLLSFMCVPEYMFATDQTTNFTATVYVFCDSTVC